LHLSYTLDNLAKKLGATHCINPKDYDKPLKEVLIEMTGGGFDYTINCTGNAESMVCLDENVVVRSGLLKRVIFAESGI